MAKLLTWLKSILSTTQTRLVLVLTVSVSLIILAVSLTSYYTSRSVLQSELSETRYQSLSIGMNFIDNYIHETDSAAIKIALHTNVYRFLTMEEQNSYNNVTQLYEFLKTVLDSSPYIESVYIYDITHQSFVGYPLGFSSRASTFPDADWIDVASQFGDEMTIVKSRKLPEKIKNAGDDQVTLFRKINIQGEMKGILAINFNNTLLFSHMIPDYVSRLEGMQYIFDQEGNPVYSVGSDSIPSLAVGEALAQIGSRKYGEFSYDGHRRLLTHIQSSTTGWQFVSVVSQDKLLGKLDTIRAAVLAVSFITLVLGGAAISYINAVTFRPVRRMRTLLNEYERNENSLDLVILEKITNKLLSDHSRLSQQIRQTLPEASSKFLSDVFAGNSNSQREISEKWERYFRDWTSEPLTVAVVSIDRFRDWSQRLPEHDHLLIKFAIANITEELLSEQWRSVSLDLGKDKIAFLLQPIAAQAQAASLVDKLKEAAQTVQRMLHSSISIGISMPHDDASKLKLALYQAENALSYRLYRGCSSVIVYDEVSSHEMNDRTIDEYVLESLIEAVEAGAVEHAQRIMERISESIQREYWYPSQALSFFHTVADKLNRILRNKEAAVWEDAAKSDDYDTMPLADICAELTKEVVRLAGHFSSLSQSKEFIMVQKMIEFMKKQLGENVGVQEISASIGISVSLASQLFKQETNETIHDYFTKLRVERAAELLLETNNKISDIARLVGYQHENSFIRVFRKLKDITPGKYREHMRNKPPSV